MKKKYKGIIWLTNPPYYETDDNGKVTVYETEIFASINENSIELSCTFDIYKYTIVVYPKPNPLFFGEITSVNEREIVGDINFNYYENIKGRIALIGTWIEYGEHYSCLIELNIINTKNKL